MMQESNYLPLVQELGFTTLHSKQVLQTLWGGYGELVRLYVDDSSVVVKHVRLPKPEHHPRGWNTDLAHQRKLKSYQVELAFYQDYAEQHLQSSPVPQPLKVKLQNDEMLLVMQDLQSLGYPVVVKEASLQQLSACLEWLAYFHAQHIGTVGERLWRTGTYWHLATRPDELAALNDQRLSAAASIIDEVLTQAPYQTLVHGDAKLANFCFSADGQRAAAVDFQYVGKGWAMKDVALFMSSAVLPKQCAKMEAWLLDCYFGHLRRALNQHQPDIDREDVERKWRPLFAIAWADFQRFVKGWSPEHWKINPYTEQLTERALNELGVR